MTNHHRALLCAGTALALCMGTAAHAATNAATAPAAPATEGPDGPIRNTDDIVVTATKVNETTPITASVHV
jgi:iron complex outermembrane receptor protein